MNVLTTDHSRQADELTAKHQSEIAHWKESHGGGRSTASSGSGETGASETMETISSPHGGVVLDGSNVPKEIEFPGVKKVDKPGTIKK